MARGIRPELPRPDHPPCIWCSVQYIPAGISFVCLLLARVWCNLSNLISVGPLQSHISPGTWWTTPNFGVVWSNTWFANTGPLTRPPKTDHLTIPGTTKKLDIYKYLLSKVTMALVFLFLHETTSSLLPSKWHSLHIKENCKKVTFWTSEKCGKHVFPLKKWHMDRILREVTFYKLEVQHVN